MVIVKIMNKKKSAKKRKKVRTLNNVSRVKVIFLK